MGVGVLFCPGFHACLAIWDVCLACFWIDCFGSAYGLMFRVFCLRCCLCGGVGVELRGVGMFVSGRCLREQAVFWDEPESLILAQSERWRHA